ncbi:vWA domain-containing protein [Sulfurimonas sp.]
MFFLYSDLLFLLLIPFVLFVLSFRKTKNSMDCVFSDSVRQQLQINPQTFTIVLRYRYFLLIIALLIVALARPVSLKNNAMLKQMSTSAVIALDVSKSMYLSDIYPNRLALAQLKLTKLIEQAHTLHVNVHLGILLFAKDAYMLYPITDDMLVLAYMFKNAELQQKFKANTNLFGALQAAKKMLHLKKDKNIILLSDGGEIVQRTEEIAYILQHNLKLYTLDFTPKSNPSLQNMTQKSGGHYVHYQWGDDDIKQILAALQNSPEKTVRKKYTIQQYQEFFSYPLGLALFILYFIFFARWKKKSVKKLFLLFALGGLPVLHLPLQAGIFDFVKLYEAQSAYEKKEYEKAIAYYKALPPIKERDYNIADILYKQQHYLQAVVYYKRALGSNKILDAKIFYNIGNCYAQRGKLASAKSYYEHSLQLHPFKQAKNNLHVITQELKKRKKLKKIFNKGRAKVCFKNTLQQRDNRYKVSSKYTIQLKKLVLSQEEKWMKIIKKQKMPVFLQKIPTKRMSIDAKKAW